MSVYKEEEKELTVKQKNLRFKEGVKLVSRDEQTLHQSKNKNQEFLFALLNWRNVKNSSLKSDWAKKMFEKV